MGGPPEGRDDQVYTYLRPVLSRLAPALKIGKLFADGAVIQSAYGNVGQVALLR
jgi:hypothetical protein